MERSVLAGPRGPTPGPRPRPRNGPKPRSRYRRPLSVSMASQGTPSRTSRRSSIHIDDRSTVIKGRAHPRPPRLKMYIYVTVVYVRFQLRRLAHSADFRVGQEGTLTSLVGLRPSRGPLPVMLGLFGLPARPRRRRRPRRPRTAASETSESATRSEICLRNRVCKRMSRAAA